MLRYGRLSARAIKMMGETAGRNCMKAKYEKSGNSLYDPYDARNIHNLEEFQQSATLGIYENLLLNDCIKGATREQLRDARRAGYKACNTALNALRRIERKHLFIEQYVDDENGNAIINIVDVTATIHSNGNEVIDLIADYVTSEDLVIIKMLACGFTYETIEKRFNCSRATAFRKIEKARAHAQKAFKDASPL